MVSFPLVDFSSKKSLILNFAWINIKIRYGGTYLGFLWTVLEPMILFIFLYLLFESIRITRREDFAIYLFTGIILYHAFTKGTLSGLASLKDNNSMLSSLNIKREFFPLVATVTTAILLLVEVGVYFGLMPFFQFIPGLEILLLPVVLILFLFLVLGMSYILSIIFVYTKDIQPLWAVFVHALFFITPIFWYLEDGKGIVLEIQKINPLGQLIEISHQIVFGNIPPLNDWLYTTVIIFGIFFAGYALFQKFEKNAMEQM